MKKSLKFLCILLTLCLVFAAGCAQTTPPADTPDTETLAPAPPADVQPQAETPEQISTETPEAETPAAETPKAEVPAPQPVQNTCSLLIDCHALLDKLDTLPNSVRRCVPENGIILSEKNIVFTEGETAFDVLLRMTREKKIHMEFSETPAYGSIYVEGIGNLYEFDGGEMSGWLYHVNGEFPSVASSEWKLKNGDAITFVYTCDLGRDVGGYVEGV